MAAEDPEIPVLTQEVVAVSCKPMMLIEDAAMVYSLAKASELSVNDTVASLIGFAIKFLDAEERLCPTKALTIHVLKDEFLHQWTAEKAKRNKNG